MSAGHAQGAHVVRDTPVHRLPADCKLVAVIAFVFIVVATPREAYWAFACYGVLLTTVAAIAQIPPLLVLRRMLIESPFVLFALLLPFVATGPRIDLLGVSVSESGVLGAWNILAKGTLGVVASILLAATTERASCCSRSGACTSRRSWCKSHRSCCATSPSSSARCIG